MKVCGGCTHEYDEDFNFCPACGRKFGGPKFDQLKDTLNQNLLDMKRQANQEAALSKRVFSGQGLGDSIIPGRVFGSENTNL